MRAPLKISIVHHAHAYAHSALALSLLPCSTTNCHQGMSGTRPSMYDLCLAHSSAYRDLRAKHAGPKPVEFNVPKTRILKIMIMDERHSSVVAVQRATRGAMGGVGGPGTSQQWQEDRREPYFVRLDMSNNGHCKNHAHLGPWEHSDNVNYIQ